jgi:hypothetical protein
MAGIPIGEVAFAGFGVIRRKPLAVLVWGLALFVLGVLPVLGAFGLMASSFGELFRQAAEGVEPSVEEAIDFQLRMLALNPLLMISSLVGRVLLTCAIFRVVLRPQDDRFFYLRLSMTEVLVGLVYLALAFLLGFLALAGVLVGVGLAMATWAVSEAAGFGIAIVLAGALIGLVIWLGLRLSMAMPMTFADRRFRFFESWALTRGHTLSLFLIGLLTVVIVWLLEMVMFGVAAAVIVPFLIAHPLDEAALAAFFNRPMEAWLAELTPWLLIGGLIVSILGSVLYAVITAPWAAAYRYLAPTPPAEADSPA